MICLCFQQAEAVGDVLQPFNPNLDGQVSDIKVQKDGKILVAGSFTAVGNQSRTGLARFNTDGTLDETFDPVLLGNKFGLNASVIAICLQNDGKILVGGYFRIVNGEARTFIARLNSNGELDANFNASVNNTIQAIAVQHDGKIIIGGVFTQVHNTARNHIARLNIDGTLDSSFDPNVTGVFADSNADVREIVIMDNGEIVLAGFFRNVSFTPRNNIARVSADGTLNADFDPNVSGGIFANISSTALSANGKIYIGGSFNRVGNVATENLARLNSDGSLDSDFDPIMGGGLIASLLIQDNGDLLVGGNVSSVNGVSRNRMARIHPNGDLDLGFDPNVTNGSLVNSIAMSGDSLFFGGEFIEVAEQDRNYLASVADPIAELSVSILDSSQLEGDEGDETSFVFQLERQSNLMGSVLVEYRVEGTGEQSADSDDFGGAFPEGSIMLEDGEASKEIVVQVSGDTKIEDNESFHLFLNNPGNAIIMGEPAAANIINDDEDDPLCVPIVTKSQQVAQVCIL